MDYKEKVIALLDSKELSKEQKEKLEEMFPELKESEDERIRKELLNAFQESEDSLYMVLTPHRRESFIAWLEKQGEQNPYGQRQECIDCQFNYAGECKGSCAMKRDEQKPAWSEEDEENLNWFEKFFRAESVIAGGKDIPQDRYLWFKNLKDRVQPQPKREWSQNDIDMIDWLIRCCEKEHEELCNDKYGHQDIVSDLKGDCRKKWDWLESLKNRVAPQSQWKPSEEQIKVCKEIYADILSAKGFDLGTINSELNRLEEELKKLKGLSYESKRSTREIVSK